MTLYYSPGACSFAAHAALIDAGIDHKIEKVNLRTHTFSGGDYYAVNPKGAVPALQLDDGQVLTENAALLQYIADLKPESGLAPKNGEFARYRLLEWLSYLSSEVHKSFSPLFHGLSGDAKMAALEKIQKVLKLPATTLAQQNFLMGDRPTVADYYLFVMLGWAHKFQISLADPLQAFHARMKDRSAVQDAQARER